LLEPQRSLICSAPRLRRRQVFAQFVRRAVAKPRVLRPNSRQLHK
jgi:hypothetical protein